MLSRSTFATGAILIGALAACAPGSEPSHTAQGAIAGATAGGLIAGTRNGSRSDAVAGAVVGATVGAVTGSIMDQQRAVQQAINDPNVSVTNDGQNLHVVFPGAVLFETSSAKLSPAGQRDLQQLAIHLRNNPNSTVTVIGHTDSTGSLEYNQILSENRARAVSTKLIAGGVAPARITTVGQGPTRPIASNDTPEGRAQNRRVEIIIRPN